MTDFELQKVLNAIRYVPSENEREEVTQIILKAASESITLDRVKVLTKKEEKADFKENGTSGFIKFKKHEINSWKRRSKTQANTYLQILKSGK